MVFKPVSPRNPLAEENGLIVFAHRGGSLLWPENTMFAFQNAMDMGADALELDVHSSADGQIVVIHDPFLDRVTNGKGAVNQYTLAELKELDAGYWWTEDGGITYPFRGKGITIPTLEEVFTAFPHRWINIDIKQVEPPIVRPFVELVRQHDMLDWVLVGSFNTINVQKLRQECPEITTAVTMPEISRFVALNHLGLGRFYRGQARALQVPPHYEWMPVVTPSFVRTAHYHGLAVHVWTVDDEEAMKTLIHSRVDGIMSDRPDILLRLLGRD